MGLLRRTVLSVMLLTIVSKILGFTREIVLAYYYGASNISDAYLISLTIPGVIFSFISVALVTGFIPLYTSILNEQGMAEGNKFTSNIINILFIISTLIVIFVFLFDNAILKIFALGFDNETLEMATTFTKIFIIGIYISGLLSIFTGFLQVHKNFFIPALGGIPFNIITILSIYFSKIYYLYFIIIGVIVAKFVQLLMLIPYVVKNKFKYSLKISLYDNNVKKMLLMGLPLIIGVSLNQINILVDRTIASTISVGGISAISYANHLNQFVQGVFVASLIAVMYPTVSKMIVDNNIHLVKKSISESINLIYLFVLPATIITMIFSVEIVTLLFARGEFDSNATLMTSDALFFYSIGMIAVGLREFLSMIFYSMKDTKTPMINAAIGIVLNIILNIILSYYLGLGGLALATSIAAIFTTILMIVSLKKKIGSFGMKHMSIIFLKILFASLIMGFITISIFYYLVGFLNQNISLIISIVVGIIIYLIIIYLMKIEDARVIFDPIKKKILLAIRKF